MSIPLHKRLSRHKLLITLILLCGSIPGASGSQENILMNGTGIYLTTGESWTFDQGYALTVKSVNPGTNEAWLELSLNGNVVKEGILREKDSLVYSRDREILNVTLDTIYSSPSGELVTFTPVYQYLDPQLPAPETNESGQEGQSENDHQISNGDEDVLSIPAFRIIWTIAGVMLAGLVKCCSLKNK
jgi:hypothetical protein